MAKKHGDIGYTQTRQNLPPVAIVDRSLITTRHTTVFGVIALVGAVAWAIVAFARGAGLKWAWIPGLALLWDLAVTLTAPRQKIFSGDPAVG